MICWACRHLQRAVSLRATFGFTRSVFGFQKSNLVVEFLFKKRLTIELTWGETAATQV
ncbi:MAG: hypothetical protein WKF71_04730 [Pyrinomonadaceae bacterium]